jgi:hypothetical protein
MATNDKGAGPILGQQVLYQVTGTHAIVTGTINGINANGSVNICQNPAPGSTTLIDRASVGFGGSQPMAREACENRIPIIYFLGIAPGRYQAMLPTFISGWDGKTLKARVAFGAPDQEALAPPETAPTPYVPSNKGCTKRRSAKPLSPPTTAAARYRACPSLCCSTRLISSRTDMSNLASRWFRTASRSPKFITPRSTHI